jgi:hypothetical protein
MKKIGIPIEIKKPKNPNIPRKDALLFIIKLTPLSHFLNFNTKFQLFLKCMGIYLEADMEIFS